MPLILRALIIKAQNRQDNANDDKSSRANPNPLVPFAESAVGLSILLFILLATLTLAESTSSQLRLLFIKYSANMLNISIFAKALRLSPASMKRFSEAEILSFTTIDVGRVAQLPMAVAHLIEGLSALIGVFALIVLLTGNIAIIPAVIVLLGTIALLSPLLSKFTTYTIRYSHADDERFGLLRDILSSIRTVKLWAAEESCMEEISGVRGKQVKSLWGMSLGLVLASFVLLLPSRLLPVEIASAKNWIPPTIVNGNHCLRRLQAYFLASERGNPKTQGELQELSQEDGPCIVFRDAKLLWEAPADLHDAEAEMSKATARKRRKDKAKSSVGLEEIQGEGGGGSDGKDAGLGDFGGRMVRFEGEEMEDQDKKKEDAGLPSLSPDGATDVIPRLQRRFNSVNDSSYSTSLRARPTRSMTLPITLSESTPEKFESATLSRRISNRSTITDHTIPLKQAMIGALEGIAVSASSATRRTYGQGAWSVSEGTASIIAEDGEERRARMEPLFESLDLEIPKGKFTAIVGHSGSGKSSLISAILGEMTILSGTLTRSPGTVALCAQQPFLLSQSLEHNILFGLPHQSEKLATAIRCCDLIADIDTFEFGLDTLVGEKGIMLSGGQKARVALARAVYQDADVYLLDDPLAALDARVGKFVFEKCLLGVLAGKTRVMATHQLHLLPQVDHIVVLEEGRVVEQGTFEDLMKARSGRIASMMANYGMSGSGIPIARDTRLQSRDHTNHVPPENASLSPTSSAAPSWDDASIKSAGSLNQLDATARNLLLRPEQRRTGKLQKQVIRRYFGLSGGWPWLAVIFGFWVGIVAVTLMRDLWLTWWTEDDRWKLTAKEYALGYGLLGMMEYVFAVPLIFAGMLGGIRAAKQLHDLAFAAVMRAPMSFFESQIVNSPAVFASLGALLYASHGALLYGPLLVLSFFGVYIALGYFTLGPYRAASREMKRIEAVQKASVQSYLGECLSGIVCIRAHGAEHRMMEQLYKLMDNFTAAEIANDCISDWFSLRIDVVTSTMTLCVMLFVSLAGSSPSNIGLAFEASFGLTEKLLGMINLFASLESNFVSAERLIEYCDDIEAEGPRTLPTDPALEAWPSKGMIEVKNLEVKYDTGDRAVVQGVSFTVRPGEKFGVVGRTGSGKSTIMAALFRLTEPNAGKIVVDGLDLSQLGLKTLRSRIHAIPQDSKLFGGTLRSNMDPEGVFEDQQIWQALEMVGLKEWAAAQPDKLLHLVERDGDNVSVGQRQLLMLARALCVKPRVLVMDEASSSVDATTELLVSANLEGELSETTVICIAHRLNTVAEFDRVAVLDEGRIVECDAPAKLLRIRDGHFRRLADATGPVNAKAIEDMAFGMERLQEGAGFGFERFGPVFGSDTTSL
ncbi:hypothetical protein HDU96_006855 [Phlyctochytrium bullatum]|nr:hypothetical protein HDU96_006855 [Phlyctochytrium bullatum]